MNRLMHFLCALLLGLNAGLSSADDTDIYVGDATVTEGLIYPNVLFVLDTSGSMGDRDGGSTSRLDRMKAAMKQIINSSNNVNMGLMRFHNEGGPILFPVGNIAASVEEVVAGTDTELAINLAGGSDDAEESGTGIVALDNEVLAMIHKVSDAGSGTLAIDVASDDDDAEQRVGNGDMSRGSSDLEMLHETPGSDYTEQLVGIRFRNLDIPATSNLDSSRIRFELDETKGADDPVSINIYGQLSLAPDSFSSNDYDISDRPRTSAVVSWSPPQDLDTGDHFYTPSLNSIINEVRSQSGWTSGNPIVFIFEHVSGEGVRTVESRDGNGDEPRLEIGFSADSGGDDQTLGYRFQQVMVPKGATITSAYLAFEAAETREEYAGLEVRAEDVDNSAAFSTATADISGRSTTTASASWSVEAWVRGERYQSPDLSDLVQEVVNRDGWCGGNAMTFIVTGSSGARRDVTAYDGDSAAAPTLHVGYDPDSVEADACISQLFQVQVVSGNDDAEQQGRTVIRDSNDLELVYDKRTDQTVGIRFRDVEIPRNANVVSAQLVFTADETNSGTTSLSIRGEAADDSNGFSTSNNDLSNRTTTSASVSWNPDAWGTVGETHVTPDIGSVVQEIVNRPGWASGNAMTFLITGNGERVAESYDGSASGAPILKVLVEGSLGTGYQTVRDKLVEITDGLTDHGYTPILDTMHEAALYFRGEGVYWGKTRGFGPEFDGRSNTATSYWTSYSNDYDGWQYTRLSHPSSYTGGSVVRPAGCPGPDYTSTECIEEYISGSPTYISPITEWCQANYMIVLSDGLGNIYQSVDLLNAGMLSGGNYTCTGHDDCAVSLAEFLHMEDQNDSLESDQTVTTYTIGFNLEDTDPDFLIDVAAAGGGSFNTADTAEELADVFETILSEILARSTSFTAPAVSVNAFNKLYHDNDVYFSLFLPARSTRWNGNLKKYMICEGNEGDTCTRGEILDASTPAMAALGANNTFVPESRSYWSLTADGGEVQVGGAGENIPSYTSRVVYTYTGGDDPSDTTLATDANRITDDDANNAADDPLRVLLGAGSITDGEYSDLIYWILGRDVADEDDDGSTSDDRWGFADPLHSQPLVVTYGKDGNEEPIKKIFIGTNEGVLRMINAASGVEEWSFIPPAMLELQRQMKTNANGDHLYGMDGDLTVYSHDADGDGIIEPPTDKVWLFSGMRRGGRNIYALDVTPGATLTNATATGGITPKLKWRIEGGTTTGFESLGQTWSSPQVVRIPYAGGAKDALVFGGGYHISQDAGFATATVGNAVYAVDIVDGSLIWSVGGASSGASVELAAMNYPIPSDLALMDSNQDRLVDRVYVGDLGGQVWRLDIQASGSGSTASGARLATVSSAASDSEKRKFFYAPDVAQVYDADYSANPEYDLVIITSGDRADPTETVVHNRVYAFRDYNISGNIPGDFTPLVPANDLYDATANLVQQGTDAEKTAAIEALNAKSGWFIDLSEDGTWIGEKGLSSPIILDNRVFFTTYIPGANTNADDTCGSPVEGFGRLYAVDILNAQAVYPNWDGTGDVSNYTKEDRDYDLWAGIPSAVVPIFQENGITLIVGGGGGGGTFDPNIELPMIRTFWLQSR